MKVQNPRSYRAATDWAAVAKFVQDSAPKWVNVGDYDPSYGTKIRQGHYAALPAGDYEVTTRKEASSAEGKTAIFMRYIGG